MFQSYFERLEKHLLNKYKPTKKRTVKTAKSAKSAKKTAKKAAAKGTADAYDELKKAVNGFIPDNFYLAAQKMCDSEGVSVDDPDFVVAERKFRAAELIFAEGIPVELVRGSYIVTEQFNRKQLVESLVKAANCKKVGRFGAQKSEESFVATFMIAFDSSYTMEELKKSILEIYREENVDPMFEVDLIVVLGKGIVIKDWTKKSSFIALDTGSDSLMWFFIIMNEYLSITQGGELDLREYIREPKRYDEY